MQGEAASNGSTAGSVVRDWIEQVWNGGDLDALDRFHPATFQNEGKPSTPEEAKAWHHRMRAAFPDVHYDIEDLFEADDRVVVRWTASGTQTGELWGAIPPTRKHVRWNGIHVVTVRGGKITDVRTASNMAGIPEQLGIELRMP